MKNKMFQIMDKGFLNTARGVFLALMVMGILYASSLYSYLLFHGLSEVFSIAVAWGMFMIVWNSRQRIVNNYIIFVGIAYLFIGLMDLMHTFAYKGMNIFPWGESNPAVQLWIASRFLEVFSFYAALLFLRRPIYPRAVFAGYFLLTAALLSSILYFDIFPDCFVEGQGLTGFKKLSEYAISSLLVLYVFILYRKRGSFDPRVFRDLVLAVVFTVMAELAFTFYVSMYGLSNLVGHYFKIFSFYLMYRAMIETGLRRPFDLLFRELKSSEEALLEKNESLKDAMVRARQAERARSEFFAKMSHEIRTPMNAIIGLTELTLDTELTEEQREQLQMVSFSAENLLHIINDILDISKMEAGRLEINRIPFDLRELLHKTVMPLRHRAEEKGLRIEMEDNREGNALLTGDPVRLSQVIINLVGNAIKFTEKGYIKVRVEAEESRPEKERLHFYVEDTGIGIAEEAQARIFDLFSQADASTSAEYGGTGLGLSIAHNIVELMGGELMLQSRPGVGSTFHFIITLEKAPWEEPRESLEAGPEPGPGKACSASILLVEDNLINQKIARRILEKADMSVSVAGDGERAVEMAASGKYDVILMDYYMPGMNGTEATRILRSRGIKTPIIALTAKALGSDREECLEAGMDDFVSKPVRSNELLGKLDEWVKPRREAELASEAEARPICPEAG